ncbi:hypothetical protein GCM10011344_24160 [Dokdonia pacifica]|uniref:TIGR02117 family protein n=1 Tax=Dokdonia pacifica TaxID=1627892 RepID=A0A238WMR8_9FLAO|nr:DUF2459 domain-containing protein [Dokdonia pacifica]GGG22556.1 hypothetical protein GCM10011344_24160 [Dokdonia pacifica]SNR47856.1 conserved hypothetical protein [Dokdonia pacifica]
MRYIKLLLKGIGYVLLIPISYIIISLILTYIPVGDEIEEAQKNNTIYLTTNGVHSDVILPKTLMIPELLKGQKYHPKEQYFAYGWGEENFFLNTPTWGELKFSTAFRAAFLESSTLMHVTRYRTKRERWIAVQITEKQLQKLNTYILQTFDENDTGKQLIEGASYTPDRDNFYKAHGNYMFYKTCNSWTNTALKESDMKASLWTPFDFGVLRWYEE